MTKRGKARERYLIVNADDFGLSSGINRGILEAHEHGIVTSASLMVRWPAAQEAASLSRNHPSLSIGLHLDLGEWRFSKGQWEKVYEVVSSDNPEALAEEIERQLDLFRQRMGREPTHLDSHQHMHNVDPLRTHLENVADEVGIPLRNVSPGVRYCGSFYGQSGKGYPVPEAIGVPHLIETIRSLPTGITELACHPSWGTDFESTYRKEREMEKNALCDSRVREAIEEEGIHLCSFQDARIRELIHR
jgi:predicted glycoside hydrolase/deacetylase ChbG (UPF0249 family)